tara:strand:- start:554 stop:1363 length:810 start_codon:yes stop_codon:yes gene_type:complete
MEESIERQKLSSINTLLLGILKNAFLTRAKLFDTFYKDMLSLCNHPVSKGTSNKQRKRNDMNENDMNEQHDGIATTTRRIREEDGGGGGGGGGEYLHSDEEHLQYHRRVHIMDMWILFAVCSHSKLEVKVHTLVAKLWMNGKLGATHIYTSIHLHAHPLMDFFPSILSLAQCTLSSTRMGQIGVNAAHFGLHLYKLVYEQFSSGCSMKIDALYLYLYPINVILTTSIYVCICVAYMCTWVFLSLYVCMCVCMYVCMFEFYSNVPSANRG